MLTPLITFPYWVCESNFPSPVITKSQSLIIFSNREIFKKFLIPEINLAFRKLIEPPPTPPAAPAPGMSAMLGKLYWSNFDSKLTKPLSNSWTCDESAPFWEA